MTTIKIRATPPVGDPRRKAPADWRPTTKVGAKPLPVELDMGEASREQGFRLNGCR